MAMSTDTKLYVAVAVLGALGAGLYLQKRSSEREAATFTYRAQDDKLPKLSLPDEQLKQVNRVVVSQPAGDAGKALKVVLEKKGEDWSIVEPLTAKANSANVQSLIDNLKTLEVSEQVATTADAYGRYDLTDDKAVHATFEAGGKAIAEFHFGSGGSRGQMARIAGKTGVFVVKGYSSYLYSRDLKGWRDLSVLKFDDSKVKSVRLVNESASFEFTKSANSDKQPAGGWKLNFKKAKGAGKLEAFDGGKVDDLLRAYKALIATDFAQGKTPAELGFEPPKATLTVKLEDGAEKVLEVGNAGEASSRWVRLAGSSELFAISSYSADWLTTDGAKFKKSDDKSKGGPPGGGMPGMPGMMPGMPGMQGMQGMPGE